MFSGVSLLGPGMDPGLTVFAGDGETSARCLVRFFQIGGHHGLFDHRAHLARLERFGDEEGRFGAFPRQQALRKSGDEDHRHGPWPDRQDRQAQVGR